MFKSPTHTHTQLYVKKLSTEESIYLGILRTDLKINYHMFKFLIKLCPDFKVREIISQENDTLLPIPGLLFYCVL